MRDAWFREPIRTELNLCRRYPVASSDPDAGELTEAVVDAPGRAVVLKASGAA
jgi:hypothetical protein